MEELGEGVGGARGGGEVEAGTRGGVSGAGGERWRN